MKKLGKAQLEFLKSLRSHPTKWGYYPGHGWTMGKGRAYDRRMCEALVKAGYAYTAIYIDGAGHSRTVYHAYADGGRVAV